MKRPLFIIIGTVFVVILLAIWVYVLFFGSPDNGDRLFSDLDFGDTNDPTVIVDDETDEEEEPTVDVTGPERLRQLTTKRVIGYEEVLKDASSTPKVYFAEAGTGHMFSIDLATGEEVRISATTIPTSNHADFTPNGTYTMIQSGQGSQSETLVGRLSTSSDTLSTRVIEENIVDFVSTADNTFLYAVQTNSSMIAKEYFPDSDTSQTLFTLPFREVAIEWGETAENAHYAYPKPSVHLEGFAFKIDNGSIRRIATDGYGFSINGNDDYALFSAQEENSYATYTYSDATDNITEFTVDTIPEKCAFLKEVPSAALCAQSLVEYDNQIPDNWYKGATSYADNIWEVDLENGGATLLVNTVRESGRELDIIEPDMNETNEYFYFQNKHDYSLWLFERIPQ